MPISLYLHGDSISLHYGPYLADYLGPAIELQRWGGEEEAKTAHLNLDIPQGANGGHSGQVRAFLEAIVTTPEFSPDLLLLNAGLHDIKRHPETSEIQTSPEQYRDNLSAITGLLQLHEIPAAWISTTHSNDELHQSRVNGFERYATDNNAYHAIAVEVMAEANLPVIDLRGFTQRLGPDGDLFADHVHFPEPIRRLQAAYLAGWLSRHLAS